MWQDFREASGCPLLFKQALSDLSVLVVAQLYQKEAVLRKKQEHLVDTSNWGTQKNAPTVGRFWIFHLYVKTCFPVCSHLYLSPFFFLLVPPLLPPAFRLYFRFVLYNTYISHSHLISCHFLYCNCIIACSVEVCSMASEEGPWARNILLQLPSPRVVWRCSFFFFLIRQTDRQIQTERKANTCAFV